MIYSDLSLVQLYYLSTLHKFKIQDIFVSVFRELIFKDVIYLKKMSVYPDILSKRMQTYFKCIKGKCFDDYTPESYEQYILHLLEQHEQLQPKKIVDYIISKVKVPGNYVTQEIIPPLQEKGCVSVSKFIGGVKLTKLGKEVLSELNDYVQGIEQMLEQMLDDEVDDKNFVIALIEANIYVFFIEMRNKELFDKIVNKVKDLDMEIFEEYSVQLCPFAESVNVDLSYLARY